MTLLATHARAVYLMFAIAVLLASMRGYLHAAEVIGSHVEFPLPKVPLTKLQKSRLGKATLIPPPGEFRGLLRVPELEGRMPAVVMIHTCHGTGYYQPWLERLNGWGMVTLSFSRCNTVDRKPDDVAHSTFDWKRGANVAFGALEYLSRQGFVDPDRIVVMGWSRLGMIPLSTLNYEGFSQFQERQFAGGIAIYPFCSFARGPHRAPLVIISAEKDDYVSTPVCERTAKETKADEFPIAYHQIAGAFHGFDIQKHGPVHYAQRSEINPDGFSADGGTLGYDREAERELVRIVRNYLSEYFEP